MFLSAETKTYSDQISFIGQPPDIAGEDVDFYLARIGRFNATRSFVKHTIINHIYCHIITEGQVHASIDGEEFLAQEGDIIFFFEGQYLVTNDSASDEWKFVFLDFYGTRATGIFNTLGVQPGNQHFKGRFNELLEPFFRNTEDAYRDNQYPALHPSVAAWQFIGLISSELGLPTKQKKLNVAEIAKTIINQEFYSDTSIEIIAKRLGISRITLFRQFKSAYGISPKQYLDNIRMKKACQLLKCSRIPIKQIAFDCGYKSIQHFSRIFRSFYELSPRAYRLSTRSAMSAEDAEAL